MRIQHKSVWLYFWHFSTKNQQIWLLNEPRLPVKGMVKEVPLHVERQVFTTTLFWKLTSWQWRLSLLRRWNALYIKLGVRSNMRHNLQDTHSHCPVVVSSTTVWCRITGNHSQNVCSSLERWYLKVMSVSSPSNWQRQEKPTNWVTEAADVLANFFSLQTLMGINWIFWCTCNYYDFTTPITSKCCSMCYRLAVNYRGSFKIHHFWG